VHSCLTVRMGTSADQLQAYWLHYRDSEFCSFPDRTSDLRSAVKIADFYLPAR
jgi:hypothetical protein